LRGEPKHFDPLPWTIIVLFRMKHGQKSARAIFAMAVAELE